MRSLVPGRLLVVALALPLALPLARLGAQGAQAASVQVSVLATAIRFNERTTAGIGFEPQLRANRLWVTNGGVLSAGVGFQYSRHVRGPDHLTVTGGFAEPRFVFASSNARLFPYLAARLALLRQSNNFATSSSGSAIGGGGGFVYQLSDRLNLDVGGAFVRQTFGDITETATRRTLQFQAFGSYALKAGLNLGLGR
jgi:hypothetical protein